MTDAIDGAPLAGGDLAAFVATVDSASVQGAGDELDLTASAVTKRIQALERRLGATLFERGRFGMRPTVAGKLLYPEARHALDALRRAQDAVREHQSTARRTVAIAASHTIGEYLLPGWLAAFRAQAADLRSQVEVVNSPGVLASLRAGEAQLGFVEGTDDLTGMASLRVYDDELVVLVAKGHPWCRRRTVPAAELADEPYATREAASGTRAVAEAALTRAGLEIAPSLEATSTQAIKRSLGGGGFTILSRLAVEAELTDGSLCAVDVDGLELRRPLFALHDPGHPPAGLAQAFWAWLGHR